MSFPLRQMLVLSSILGACCLQPPISRAGDAAPVLDWTTALGAVARVEVRDGSGAPIRTTYGTVLGEPADLVVPLADLKGGVEVVAEFSGGTKLSATTALATDPIHGLALLDLEGTPPPPPMPDDTIRWRTAETIHVIPGPGMPPEPVQGTSTEPLKLDRLLLVPMTGLHPAGLAVMHSCGRWIGLTGKMVDPTGERSYLIPKESIYPLLFGKPQPRSIDGIEVPAAAWMDPKTVEGCIVRGVLTGYEKPEEALPFFDLALQKDRKVPEIHYWMGKNFFRRQLFAEAEATFLEAARLRPAWGQAFYMAGAAANQQAKYAEALAHYEKALAVEPDNAVFLNNKWGALYNLGRMDEAVAALRRALEIDPDYAMAMYNLAITYDKQGKRNEAEEQYNALLAVDKTMAGTLRKRLDE